MFWFLASLAAYFGYHYITDQSTATQATEPQPGQRQFPRRTADARYVSTEREAAAPRASVLARRNVTENETKVLSKRELDEEARRMQNWLRSEFYRGNNAGEGKAQLLSDIKTQPNPQVITFNRLPLVQPGITRLELPEPGALQGLEPLTPESFRISAATVSEAPVAISDEVRALLTGGVKKASN